VRARIIKVAITVLFLKAALAKLLEGNKKIFDFWVREYSINKTNQHEL